MTYFENIKIEKLNKEDLNEVAQLLTSAFETNPAYSLIFNKTKNQHEGLLWLFKTNLFLINHKQNYTNIIREQNTRKIIGAFTIIPPAGIKVNFINYFRIGLPGFIMKFGFSTLHRMLKMDAYNKEILYKAIQGKEHYYLSMVAIREEYRGKGIGSYVLKNCLNELSQKQKKCHLMGLTTQLSENVEFYSKLGFKKIEEGTVYYKEDSYYNYNMELNL